MAAVIPRNQGKTEFVRDVLRKNPHANAKIIVQEWQASGREGTISDTLVNKQRSEMRLTGNLRGKRAKRSAPDAAEKPMYTGKKRGRKPKSASVIDTAPQSNGKPAVEPRAKSSGRHNQLTSLEAEIDVLLFKVMNLGGLEEIENSLSDASPPLRGPRSLASLNSGPLPTVGAISIQSRRDRTRQDPDLCELVGTDGQVRRSMVFHILFDQLWQLC